MNDDLSKAEQKIEYVFGDKQLLKTAFTHSSYANEHGGRNNERLEFLGDSVLGFVISDYLFRQSERLDEGDMTQKKQRLVSSLPLADVCKKLGLGRFLLVGEGLKKNNLPRSVMENLCESVIAAIYLDGGLSSADKFIKKFVLDGGGMSAAEDRNYKGKLQEYTQAEKTGIPKYEIVAKTGPEHSPIFTVSVSVNGKAIAAGSGKSKAEASQSAARRALKKLTGRDN